MWTFLTNVLGGGIGAIAAWWLTRQFFLLRIKKDIIDFKAKLEQQNAIELAHIHSELENAKSAYQTQFALLQERRVQIVEEIYSKFYEFSYTVSNVSHLARNEIKASADAHKKVTEAIKKFSKIYIPSRPFLTTETCTEIDKIQHLFSGSTNLLLIDKALTMNEHPSDDLIASRGSAVQELMDSISVVSTLIENELRSIIIPKKSST